MIIAVFRYRLRPEANLEELEYLRKSIGKTGMLAMDPVLRASGRDLWQLRKLNR